MLQHKWAWLLHPTRVSGMKKYCLLTFLFWLFGGWCGLHHFYLGRDRQGFLWATSWGGFLIGWLRDFTSLARYTDEANNGYPIRASKRPALFSEMHRMLGILVFVCFYRMIFVNAIPTSLPNYNLLVLLIAPLGSSFGAYLVSNVGHISLSIKFPLVSAYAAEVLFGETHLLLEESNVTIVSLVVCISCVAGWRERQRNMEMSVCQRFCLWFGLGLVVLCLWGCYGYYNAEVYVENLGESVKLSNIIKSYFTSPEWAEFREVLYEAFWILIAGDYDEAYMRFTDDIAKSQIHNALRVLEFGNDKEIESLTLEELKSAYKRLAREWHPDKVIDPDKKEEAQSRFIEIKEAYELLERHMKKQKTRTS